MTAQILKHHAEFQELLGHYRPSPRAVRALENLRLVLMVAPSSTGRNTIIRRLLNNSRYYYIVSDTTRQPQFRDGRMETDGDPYFFRSEEQMLADVKAGEFLEAELIHGQQVSGISIRELEKAKNEGKVAVTDVDIGGIDNVLKVKPDTVAILLLPPSFTEWQRRVSARGELKADEYRRRMQTAVRVFETGLKNPNLVLVIADDVDRSAAVINEIVKSGNNPDQAVGKKLLIELYKDSKDRLSV